VKKRKSNITFAHKLDIEYPEQESAYLVPKSDWKRLRKRVEGIKPSKPAYFGVATLLLGLGTGFLSTSINFPQIEAFKRMTLVIIAAIFFSIGGMLIFLYRKYLHAEETYSRQDAIDCLDEIEGKFPKHTETEPPNTMPTRKENG
jgi:hypothetical protein